MYSDCLTLYDEDGYLFGAWISLLTVESLGFSACYDMAGSALQGADYGLSAVVYALAGSEPDDEREGVLFQHLITEWTWISPSPQS